MNGLSQVLDPFVANSYQSFSLNNQLSSLISSETIVSSERQLAFETYSNKALEDRDSAQPIVCSTAQDFDNGVYNGLTDADSCLNNYFCDSQLTPQEWNHFNESLITDNNLNTEPLIDSNDLNQCLNGFDTHFDTNIDINSNPNDSSIKQNPKKANNKLTNAKKLSRKDSNLNIRPPKPVSAYALFFRDAQSLIKSANPSASFGEISKVVASNWEALDKKDKNIYKERADYEKKNYLKTLASSRAQQIAGLMANTTAKLGLSSTPSESSVASNDNKLTNETNRQNETTNSFNSTQQMSDKSSSLHHNSSGVQNYSDNSSLQQNVVTTSEQSASGVPKQHCIRSGCGNDAIDSSEWDSEYCSSECCVKHCADVFQAWVQRQQFPQN